MPRDHYIPASVIGRFSYDGSAQSRDRVVFAAREGQSKPFRTKASGIGFVNNLYNVDHLGIWYPDGTAQPRSVDECINGYEPKLPELLDQLATGESMTLEPWLRTLVPFVASLFVRGADFAHRFESRGIVVASGVSSRDNTHGARLIEYQRLLALVMGARWTVLHNDKLHTEEFILNDLGLMPMTDIYTGDHGWAIPVGLRTVLGVFPKVKRTVAAYRGGQWWPVVEHRALDLGTESTFNKWSASWATSWIAGPRPELVERYATTIHDSGHSSVAVMERWPFDHQTRVAHDRDWHRLLCATHGSPAPEEITAQDLQDFEPTRLTPGWFPPIVMTLNMYELPTGLSRRGNLITLELRKPENYNDFFIPPGASDTA